MRFQHWVYTIPLWLRSLLRRDRLDAELDEELRDHIDRQIEDNMFRGMSPEEARVAALRRFGNPALLRDQTRATWSWNGLEQFVRDLRIGIRTLSRTPGFAIIAILVTTLGIGANVALFTVVRSVLLKPLPFTDPNSLLMLYEHSSFASGDFPYNGVAGGVYTEWNNRNRTFSGMGLTRDIQVDLSGSGGDLPETLNSALVSWNMFPMLGVKPVLGRGFTAADDDRAANATVVLSWSLWKRRFGGEPAIVNETIYLDGKPYQVIGVMPAWFAFPESSTQLWIPAHNYDPEKIISALANHTYRVVGRLKPGITPAQASADLTVITRQLHNAHLDDPFVSAAASSRPLLEHMVGPIERPLYVLLAATACLLLIACLNVANLLVARAAARRRELAVRTALGGSRFRLLREHLMESFLLSVAGGAGGLVLANGAISWLVSTRHDLARASSIHLDGAVAAFTVGVIVLCALFSGLISALNANDKQILGALHESSTSHSAGKQRASLRKVLLAAEVGLTVVLLVGASLLIKSYQRLRSVDIGCLTNNVLTMRIVLPGARYKTPGPAPANFFASLLERVQALPGVQAAGLVTAVPGQGYFGDIKFTIAEHPPLPQGNGLFAIYRYSDPGYFAALGIPFLSGHTFDDGQVLDRANEVIISESFAQKFFPGEDPIGKHLLVPDHKNTNVVVGVVGDTRYAIGDQPQPMQYFPLFLGNQNYGTLVVRSGRDVEQLAVPVQRIIQSMDHDLPVSDVLTMDQLLGKSTLDQRFDAALITGFAVLSLLLATAGLFGVLSYIVAQRSGEIAIRMALGAQRGQVLGLILADGLRPALVGLILGLAAGAAVTQSVKAMLYETQPLDPEIFVAVAALLIASAALACLVPAWRASRLDPMRVLRMD